MGVVTRAQAKGVKSRQSDGEEPPPRGGRGEGGLDLISLLPTRSCAASSPSFAPRKAPVPRSSPPDGAPSGAPPPLNLEAGMGSIDLDVASRILAEHQGAARRFNAWPYILDGDSATVDRWLRCPVLDNLQELDFCFSPWVSTSPLMPHSALRFSSTLRVAKFKCCQFPGDAAHQLHFPNLQHLELGSITISDDSLCAILAGCPALHKFGLTYRYDAPRPPMPPSALCFPSTLRVAKFGGWQFPNIAAHQVHFPNLQHLKLEMMIISEGALHAMLSGCPALNSLKLCFSSGFRQLRINSLKLKHVEMLFRRADADRLQELIVESVPCLERLNHRGPCEDSMQISIISAPKLKILGQLTENICRLELGATVFMGLHDVRIATVMQTVKVLTLRLDNLRLDVIINFMNCFPCMDELSIKTHIARKSMQHHYPEERIECLDHHLRKLRISYYSGKRSHVEFVKFFVLNASVLESLVLDINPYEDGSVEWIENQRRQLQLEKRASIGAKIDFHLVDSFDYLSDI